MSAIIFIAFLQGCGEESTFQDCDTCPQMVVVEPGSFFMGSEDTRPGSNPGPGRVVSIGYRFAISQHEVTMLQWKPCVEAGICNNFWEKDDSGVSFSILELPENMYNRPVSNVDWYDAKKYIQWLSSHTAHKYRLPTEAEWEYAARGGTETDHWWGNGGRDECLGRAHNYNCGEAKLWTKSSVGSYAPNPFGLYDTAGNVREWVEDCFFGYDVGYRGAPANGDAWTTEACSYRVIRGGHWTDGVSGLRSNTRFYDKPEFYSFFLGFRVVRELPQ
jgi:formylglycine-generating enzyme required for sulfatase activity